jgi:hypothetical protein
MLPAHHHQFGGLPVKKVFLARPAFRDLPISVVCSSAFAQSFRENDTMLEHTRGNGSVASAVAVTALLYGLLIFARLGFHNFDVSFFIVAGHAYSNPSSVPEGLRIDTAEGYDGQFYYRLALDPLNKQRVEYGITIDRPSYRQQRILYPLLARIVALCRTSWIPWSMIVVNYLAVCGLAVSAARFAEFFGLPAIYGLAIPFYPGVLLGLDRDLPDPLAISLMVTSLYLLHSRRVTLAACMLSLAVLTRETVILLAGALFVHSVWRSLRRQSAWTESMPLAIPLAAFAAWQLWILTKWGTFGPAAKGSTVLAGLPLVSVGRLFVQSVYSALSLHPFQLLELLFLGAMILLVVIVLVRSKVEPGVKLAWCLYLALAAFLSGAIWLEDWAFMRGCEELMVLGFVIVLGARERRLLPIVLAPTMAIWLALAARTIFNQ